MTGASSVVAALLLAGSWAGWAAAAPAASGGAGSSGAQPDLGLHADAVAALERGSLDDAIDRFELLADRGFVHADASYDRGVAYARRSASAAARPGDAGRACAAFVEASQLRPGDAGAEAALETVRAELARRRRGGEAVLPRPPFVRGLFALTREDVWAGIALAAALAAAGALARLLFARDGAARASSDGARPGPLSRGRLAALAVAVAGCVLTVLAAAGMHVLASARRELRPAVVVSAGARLLDAAGVPVAAPPGGGEGNLVPEGALVEVRARRGGLAEVAWGDGSVWIRADDLRWLSTSP